MDLDLREITDTPHVPETFRLRYEVWDSEALLRPQVKAARLITDEHDAHARHWAVFHDGVMHAAARMCIHDVQAATPDAAAFLKETLSAPIATLNRLIVHPRFRNLGAAAALDDCRISAARRDGAKCVVGTFPASRIASLERLGFRLTGQLWTPNHAETFVAHAMVLEL
jgi:GNAT superfamily N-acetyltransferase